LPQKFPVSIDRPAATMSRAAALSGSGATREIALDQCVAGMKRARSIVNRQRFVERIAMRHLLTGAALAAALAVSAPAWAQTAEQLNQQQLYGGGAVAPAPAYPYYPYYAAPAPAPYPYPYYPYSYAYPYGYPYYAYPTVGIGIGWGWGGGWGGHGGGHRR
jgi:hypothetical protein